VSTKNSSLRIVKKNKEYYVESFLKKNRISISGPFSHEEAVRFKEMSHVKRKRYKKRRLIQKLKNKPCKDCKYQKDSNRMTFDHVKGKKKFDIADAPKKSWDALRNEVKKCEVVCRSCHNVREYLRGRVKRLTSVIDLASLLSITLSSGSS
jgi:hypothetical protein